MDYNQALEVLHNLRSLLFENGEITVTPKMYSQVQLALSKIEEEVGFLSDRADEAAETITQLRSELSVVKQQYTAISGKTSKKKK